MAPQYGQPQTGGPARDPAQPHAGGPGWDPSRAQPGGPSWEPSRVPAGAAGSDVPSAALGSGARQGGSPLHADWRPAPGGHPGPAGSAEAWSGRPGPAGPEAAGHGHPSGATGRPGGDGAYAHPGPGIPAAGEAESWDGPVPHAAPGAATADARPTGRAARRSGTDEPPASGNRRAARRSRTADPADAATGHPADADPGDGRSGLPGGRRRSRGTGPAGAAAGALADQPAGRAARRTGNAEPPAPGNRRTARRSRTADAAGSGSGSGRGSRRAGGGAGASGARGQRRGRRVVKGVGLCAAIVACGVFVLRAGEARGGIADRTPAPAAAADAPDPGRVLQIVAHPDDDLYFMNPDLRYSIAAGHPVTTVYLTAGEADGINATEGKQASTPPNKPAYAEARQNGIRAAYAKMATGDRSSAWKRTAVPTKGGGHAEVDVLVAKPEVNLVWLQLREAGTVYDSTPDSLHGLWDGKISALGAQLSSGTPVKQRFSYSKEQLVQTVAGILEQYKPTTVRAQDPTPGRFPDKRYADHQDHFYGARFAQAALAAYAKDVAPANRPHFAVQNYLGYSNGSLPSALDPDEAKAKLDILDTYAWLDRQNHCGSDAGCGDLKVADHPAGNGWTSTVNYARGTGTSWLTSDKEHGLWAFKVLDGQVAVWHRSGPIGAWSGPRLLPGTGMDPGISTVTLPDGRIAAFGTRTSFGSRPTDYRREVGYVVQKGPGSEEFGDWQSLGTPEGADENWTSDISAPAVSVDGTGQLAAYVRDGASTLRGRVQLANGTWGPWSPYGGADLHGTPVTAMDGAGRRMVFAATAKSVLGWAQPKPGAPLGPATPTGLPDTTLPLTAEGREGGVRLWFRKPGSGNVRTALVTGDGGLKVNHLTDLGGLQGFGSVAASGHVLAGRSAGGQLGSDLGSGRPWERSPLMFVGAPSSTTTGRNTVSLAVVGLDARLYVTSSADDANAHLAPWLPVGPRNTGR
ncbi:PIG-L family deacetylase [Streptomyces katrae]|uniref:PIG-L family deacetylase n=1 Tax=Streptomyces katrae TaxID=68223 RepID=UPI00131EBAA3|nr:PIG-L family deacetylase [Streptomyces katrae]